MLIGSIVLAGGGGARLGQPKAELAWGESSLLGDRVDMLLDCTYPVVVVARDRDQPLPPLHTECELAYDEIPGAGPLVAVLAGLEAIASRCDAALVLGCDFPFVDARLVAWLAKQLGSHTAVVPRDGVGAQPLCALYRTSLLPDVRRLVARGERAAQAIAGLAGATLVAEAPQFDPERRFLFNLNTREDYEQALQWRS